MFSGIISGAFPVKKAVLNASGLSLQLEVDENLIFGLERGASVAINGVCLSVVGIGAIRASISCLSFDVVPETLKRSNLSELKPASIVNVERSIKFGDEIGGHICSGHVDGTVSVSKIEKLGDGAQVEFLLEGELNKFILEKGFVALNGASLTIAKKLPSGFQVAFIPETLKTTNFGLLSVGSKVNLEIDRSTQAIVETVERILSQP